MDENDWDLEAMVGSRLANQYIDVCGMAIKEVPFIYQEAMLIQKKHRKVMKGLYPNEDIREFNFDIDALIGSMPRE
jgi:formyltetrahydrofolate synthetase